LERIPTLKKRFVELYGETDAPIRYFHAPGRVNLIGEHTDYNGGYVFPAALTFGTTLLIRKRNDRMSRFASTNVPIRRTISMDNIVFDKEDDWVNYPKGIMDALRKRGFSFGGYDFLYDGQIPNGAGLSSSASIEVVTAYALLAMEGATMDKADMARLAQEAENRFVGVHCGIMDPFAVAMGRENYAILLKCDTLEYRYVPFRLQDYTLVIGNTNKRRGLADSAYNERRRQCDEAVRYLQTRLPGLELLGQLSPEQFRAHADAIPDPVVLKRARHVVEENERVQESVKALERGDLSRFGQLMNDSHDSLRDLYEVTGRELDAMVDAARNVPGVLGSRMTGAGFGGCTISLVHKDSVETFKREVGRTYRDKTGLNPDFYVCSIGDGVKQLEGDV